PAGVVAADLRRTIHAAAGEPRIESGAVAGGRDGAAHANRTGVCTRNRGRGGGSAGRGGARARMDVAKARLDRAALCSAIPRAARRADSQQHSADAERARYLYRGDPLYWRMRV